MPKNSLNHTFNPFSYGNSHILTDLIISLMDSGYKIEIINDNEKKYINTTNDKDFYYVVYGIHMDADEYNQYKDKQILHQKLNKTIINKDTEKKSKI